MSSILDFVLLLFLADPQRLILRYTKKQAKYFYCVIRYLFVHLAQNPVIPVVFLFTTGLH